MKQHYSKSNLLFFLFSSLSSLLFAQAGALDSTFGINGVAHNNLYGLITDITMQPDNKILAAGIINYQFALARYNANGTLDNTFGSSGVTTTAVSIQDQANAIALQPDGKIIVGGNGYIAGSYNDLALVRYKTNGSLDSTFGVNGISLTALSLFDDKINDIALQTDGKIVVAGTTASPLNTSTQIRCIARFTSFGKLDSTFGTNGYTFPNVSVPSSSISKIAIQQDGKIIAVGVDGQNFTVQRYDTTGLLDNNFGSGGTVITNTFNSFHDDRAIDVVVQPNGGIVVGGTVFVDALSNYSFGVARYLSNGSLDNSFGTNGVTVVQFLLSLAGEHLTAMGMQNDGKILLTGYLDEPAASTDYYLLARIKTDGTLDSTFGTAGKVNKNLTSYDDYPNALAVQANGRIVLAGTYGTSSYYNFGLMRFHYRYEDTTCHAYFHIFPDTLNQGVYYGLDSSRGNGLTYLWTFGDGDSSTQHYPSHMYAQAGQYNVCLTVFGNINCTSTYCDSSFLVFKTDGGFMNRLEIRDPNALSVSETTEDFRTAVYPNPADDELYIYSDKSILFTTIVDLQGRVVIKHTAGNRIAISNLASGAYIAEIKTKDATIKRRWMKM